MLEKIRKFTPSPVLRDLLEKLLILLSGLYLLFFGAETILPGIIMDIFNINIILILIIANLFLLVFFGTERKASLKFPKKIMLLIFLVGYLSFVIIFSLYRAPLIESVVYLLLSLAIGWFIFSYFREYN